MYNVEYIDEIHTYLVNGIIVPSVSQLIHENVFPDKYKGVPKKILQAKAEYGTEVHSIIEKIENSEEYTTTSVYIKESIKQYFKLKDEYNVVVKEQEKIVNYKDIYAGRFDMVAEINGSLCLCDIKTTAELDLEYLSWQLSMYELAYGKKFDKLIAIWLPKKGLGKIVEVERIEKEKILKMIGEERC